MKKPIKLSRTDWYESHENHKKGSDR